MEKTRKAPTKENGNYHICFACKGHLNKGKIPPMSHMNNLQLFDISCHPELQVSELENSLIALNLIFQKIHQLPKSRYPATHDKIVNIPIYESDVLKTVEALPRTPSEAGIIPIKLKRKIEYKNAHKIQYVSVEKVLKAIQTLKEQGHKYYQFIPEIENFKEKCKEKDVEGFKFLFPNEAKDIDETETPSGADTAKQNDSAGLTDSSDTESDNEQEDIENENSQAELTDSSDIESDEEEHEYITKDPVRKYQFEYNQSTCFSNNYPEINYKDIVNNAHEVAPGEGKTPTNILQENDWDLKTFPCLHPDGKNGIHEERNSKLSEQNYFSQRIMNQDERFANNPAYIFAATAYIEKKQMERNIAISGIRGKSNVGADGYSTYTLDNPFSVLDNIKNTPRYWQKAKSELIARLENLGPFTFFFTLSCADMRWDENFTSLLFFEGHKITYTQNEDGSDDVEIDGKPLDEFLRENVSKHEFIKKNLLNATLNFQHRVKMFVNKIIMSKFNPMSINFHSYKVEFAIRGAAHIHGVLWVDWEKCEAVPDEEIMIDGEKVTINHMERIKSVLRDIKNDEYEEGITDEKLESLVKFVDTFVTVTLMDPDAGNLVRLVNMHHHTKACRKYGCFCRFHYPKFPSLKTIISVPARLKFKNLETEERQQKIDELRSVLKKVQNILENDEIMKTLEEIKKENIEEYKKGNRTPEELEEYKRIRLEALLKMADIEANENGDRIPKYEEALRLGKTGFSIVYKRDISEIYVNTYNKEWLLAWDGNIDIQPCFDYFGVITYISDYFTKDDSGTLKHIKEALKNSDDDLKTKLRLVVNTFLTHRQIGESEAYYRILPSLQMKSSNTECKFLPTGFKKDISVRLERLDEEKAKFVQGAIKIDGRDGLYFEKPTLLDKFERRDCEDNKDINELSYTQFGKRYIASRTGPKKSQEKDNTANNAEGEDEEENFESEINEGESNQFEKNISEELITKHSGKAGHVKLELPKFIKLTNVKPGEPAYMKLRSPYVIRFHKVNRSKKPHDYIFSELQKYKPFKSEAELFPDDYDACLALYIAEKENIQHVKSLLLPHLEGVEEGTEQAEVLAESNAGANLDPANEQDNADCEEEGESEHPDYLSKDPTDFLEKHEASKSDSMYKKIELCDDEKMEEMTLRLDEEQRRVLEIGVNYAKNVVKSEKIKDGVTGILLSLLV